MTDNFILNTHNQSNVPRNVVTATVDPTVTTIENHAFSDCTALTSINMHDQVIRIGGYVFSGCRSLTSIRIPNEVTEISHYAFSECTALTSIRMHDQVRKIGGYAFRGCTALTSISIPNQVWRIADYAFFGCTALTSIRIPDQVIDISDYAFSECTALTSICIPDKVIRIGNDAFSQCTALTSIRIADRVDFFGERAFSECTALTSIRIPDRVNFIGRDAFRGCTALTSIRIRHNQARPSFGRYAFSECTALNRRQANGKNYHAATHTWLQQRFNDLPLHQACFSYNTITNTHITDKNNFPMFVLTDAMLMTPLHVLCCNPTATPEMIQMLKAADPRAASMTNVMNKTPLIMLLESKYSAFHDERGQLLPLVVLLEQGLVDFDALEMIKSASVNVSELEVEDETSGLLPFMYGAYLGNCGLDVVYELAMEINPSLLSRTH